ncbi:hypothetical protein [Demequina subtropica]|uniref:hypothetical protein n=1 Tax=Demequina subtropica TaxID=1638989 RepID=UPI0007801FBE|nr:hypothetical protein [Demequina subtropica]
MRAIIGAAVVVIPSSFVRSVARLRAAAIASIPLSGVSATATRCDLRGGTRADVEMLMRGRGLPEVILGIESAPSRLGI